MKYRHELKQEITYMDMLILRQRLSRVMRKDRHTIDGKYKIRSLYFDNSKDKALREKIDGVNKREKFRIRYYNDDTSFINLEKKSKINGLCLKESAKLTIGQTQSILEGNCDWMAKSDEPLIRELHLKMQCEGLKPKVVLDYIREPFVFEAGNVRVTLDYNIKTGMSCQGFLDESCITVPIENNPIILEIKWDEYLPDIMKDVVQLDYGRVAAFSKYAASRMYD